MTYFPVIAQVIATLLGLISILAASRSLFQPQSFASTFGLPPPTTPSKVNDAEPNPWIPLTGVRNIFFGIIIIVFQCLGDTRAMGMVLLTGAIIPTADALTVWKMGKKEAAWNHVNGAWVSAGLGVYLYWIS